MVDTLRTGEQTPAFGLSGPSSVTWQLHADPAMWFAGISSLFLQALHPRAAAGVVQNSNFREDPFGRLIRTANFVGVSTYGQPEHIGAAAAKVREIHRSLRGTDPRTGERFRIDDPELLRWVHCTEAWSFLSIVRRAGYPMTDRQADRYLHEQRTAATLVGLHADEVPGSVAEMTDYLAEMRPELARTAESDVILRFLHWPPIPRVFLPGLPVYTTLVGHVSYSLLPDWAIRLHGRPAYPAPVATLMLRTMRRAVLGLPTRVRWARPEPFALRAIDRLGPWSTPSPHRMPRD